MVRLCVAVAAVLSTALAAPSVQDGKVAYIGVSRQESLVKRAGLTPVEEFLINVNGVLAKYNAGYQHPLPADLLKRAVGGERLYGRKSHFQAPYYGDVQINSQTFSVGLDTGSANLWVPAPGCDGCPLNKTYNERGTPLHKNIYLDYGSGSVNGTEWTDTVSIGGLTAKNTALTAIKTCKGFTDAVYSGLLGLGRRGAAEGHYPTVIEKLLEEGQLSKPEFSLYLGTQKKGPHNGWLTIGGTDPRFYTGNFTKVISVKKGSWTLQLDGTYLNGTAISSSSATTFIDTGVSGLYAPPHVVSALAKKIPGGRVVVPPANNGAFLAFPCKEQFTIALGFNGKQFNLERQALQLEKQRGGAQQLIELLGAPKDDIIENSPEEYCMSNIAGVVIPKAGPLGYLIGDALVRSYYTTFSFAGNGSLSFALAK